MSIVTTAAARLEIIRISDAEWRVSDPRRRDDDALCLIGFVQRVDDAFEVTVIGRPRERHYFRTFDHATRFLGQSGRMADGYRPAATADGHRARRWPPVSPRARQAS